MRPHALHVPGVLKLSSTLANRKNLKYQMSNEQRIAELLDRQDISDVIKTYARALDRFDEPLLRSVFHPDSQHAHGFQGPSSDPSLPSKPGDPKDFVAYAFEVLQTHSRTQHLLGNILIEVDGDNAYAETYFSAYHRMRALGDPLAASNAYDTEMDWLVGGRVYRPFSETQRRLENQSQNRINRLDET